MGGPSMDLVALGLRPIDELPAPERSAFEAAEACSPPPSPPPLPEGWQPAVIFATGRRYYVHAASGRTSWQIPSKIPPEVAISPRSAPLTADARVLNPGRGGSAGTPSLEVEAEAAPEWDQVIDPNS